MLDFSLSTRTALQAIRQNMVRFPPLIPAEDNISLDPFFGEFLPSDFPPTLALRCAMLRVYIYLKQLKKRKKK
jgi:hypothetical protein